jgi:putative transposase
MARPLRLEFPGAVYRISARGNARQAIVADDDDRRRFVELPGREVSQQRWACHAGCLMDNHYHLLIETPEGNRVSGMRRLSQTYTQSFNRRFRQVGHPLQERYESIVVDKDSYLLELCRYVVLNPVRAGMVRAARDWRWSRFRARRAW